MAGGEAGADRFLRAGILTGRREALVLSISRGFADSVELRIDSKVRIFSVAGQDGESASQLPAGCILSIVKVSRWKTAALWAIAGPLAIAAILLVLEGAIRLEARATGSRAAARFGGDRIVGLSALMGCGECSLRDRDMAVWALGELRDRRSLPVLKAHYTGRKCDHTADLCQYELGKAIMKIEGAWNLHSSEVLR